MRSPTCDGCDQTPTRVCACSRCAREDESEKFHVCASCGAIVSARHHRVRGREAEWVDMPGVAPPGALRATAEGGPSNDFEEVAVRGRATLYRGDAIRWLRARPPASLHAVVTDPPYGLKEYEPDQIQRRERGRGGVWRQPPALDGHVRAPLPRFTALTGREREDVRDFFVELARALEAPLRPGAHVFVASNAFLSQLVFGALVEGGLEFRGALIRLVRTLRGGDRPKNAEQEFPEVSSMARGGYEPWGIFRKPMPRGMKVRDCLRAWQTGALRRVSTAQPFGDVIPSGPAPRREREVAPHPSLKPQAFLRAVVRASLPLGSGVVADPFMGSGSTLAAAESLGLPSVGVERARPYFAMALEAVPRLAAIRGVVNRLTNG